MLITVACSNAISYGQSSLYTEGPGVNLPFEDIRDEITSNGYAGPFTTIDVNNALVEGGLYGEFNTQDDLKIHTLGNSVVGENSFGNWSRWYQEDGATQIFRLFPGEENVRNSRPLAARIEAFDTNTGWNVADGEWHDWVARYTIIKPINAAIFQAKDNDDEAWSVHLNMNQNGRVSVTHRRPLPGQPKTETLVENAIGQPFDIRVRDNGLDYEVYFGNQSQPFTSGQYVRNSDPGDNSDTRFRWGIYVGAQEVTSEAMIFVSHASVDPDIDISVDPPVDYGTLIAGWDTWNSGSNPTASVTATGITGTAVTTSEGLSWRTDDGRGASADGNWGTFAGPPTASIVAGEGVTGENLELPNATTGGTITFTVTNNGTEDIELDGFHFDSYAFRPKAARAYELSVASGDITNGVIYTSADDEITTVSGAWDNLAHDDISHSLLGLADNILEVGGTVDFLLAFSSGEGDGSGGHDLWVDNVAITAAVNSVPGDFDGDGDVDGADFLEWQRNAGTAASLTSWENNYGAPAPLNTASGAVPEPSSVALLMLATATFWGRRWTEPRCNQS